MSTAVHALELLIEPDATPASVPPAVQIAAVASLAGFCDSCGNVPLDRSVLFRTTNDAPSDLADHLACVLGQVDGHRSLAAIAIATGMPLPAVIGAYLELFGMGLVDDAQPQDQGPPPAHASGTFRRITLSWEED
jgi:hypothetical protein